MVPAGGKSVTLSSYALTVEWRVHSWSCLPHQRSLMAGLDSIQKPDRERRSESVKEDMLKKVEETDRSYLRARVIRLWISFSRIYLLRLTSSVPHCNWELRRHPNPSGFGVSPYGWAAQHSSRSEQRCEGKVWHMLQQLVEDMERMLA